MGGKVWTEKEEKMFWLQIIPQSPKRIGADKANPEKSWKDLAKEMQQRLGDDSKRKYTALMLFEHYFQNAVNRKFSPKARRLAEDYIAKQNPEERDQQKMSRRRMMQSFSQPASSSGSNFTSASSANTSGSEEDHAPRINAPAQQVSLPSFNQVATVAGVDAGGYYGASYPQPVQPEPRYYSSNNQYGHGQNNQYGYGENSESYPYAQYAQHPQHPQHSQYSRYSQPDQHDQHSQYHM